MQDEQENVCCQKRTCVTSYVMFNTTCLDREVLQLAIRARCDIRADEPDYSTQSYRKAAYRRYTLWKYGKLGRGNRKILPSCVDTIIRQPYPAPDGNYMGFRRQVHRCIETKCILRLFPHKISIFPRFCRVALLRPIGDSEFALKYQCIMYDTYG